MVASGDRISYVAIYMFKVNMLIWSHFVKILCNTPKISSQQIKIIKSGPHVIPEEMLANWSHFMLSHLHEFHAKYSVT